MSDLALMTGLDKPLDVGFERGPPEAIKEDVVCGVKALVAEFVVSVAYEGILNGGVGKKLMPATGLSPPKLPSCDEEAVCSANKMGQCVNR